MMEHDTIMHPELIDSTEHNVGASAQESSSINLIENERNMKVLPVNNLPQIRYMPMPVPMMPPMDQAPLMTP